MRMELMPLGVDGRWAAYQDGCCFGNVFKDEVSDPQNPYAEDKLYFEFSGGGGCKNLSTEKLKELVKLMEGIKNG